MTNKTWFDGLEATEKTKFLYGFYEGVRQGWPAKSCLHHAVETIGKTYEDLRAEHAFERFFFDEMFFNEVWQWMNREHGKENK